MIAWCLCPYVSATLNGFGVYDALSAVLANALKWGIPYFVGRAFFTDIRGLRELAIGVLIGGIIYVPLCLWELRMSPHLHLSIYGFREHNQFGQLVRYGGYRPTVFLQHGLAVAIWMSFASLIGLWLWRSGTLKTLWRVPVVYFVPPLFVTTILCKSLNAVALLAIGCLVYFTAKNVRTAIPVFALLVVPPLYMALRTTDVWSGESLVSYTEQMVDEERAESLNFRLFHERRLLDRALEQKFFGWSGWGRSRIHNAQGGDLSATDGIWVIVFGVNGLVGLISWAMTILLPVVALLRRCPIRLWSHRLMAPASAFAVLLCLHMIDNLFNALVSPIFTLAAAGLIGLRKEVIVAALKSSVSTSLRRSNLRPTVSVPVVRAPVQRL
jgi:hypothetical protein